MTIRIPMRGFAPARRGVRDLLRVAFAACAIGAIGAFAEPPPSAADFAQRYAREVDRRLALPVAEAEAYAGRLADALASAGVLVRSPQFVVLIDRSAAVQAAFVYWGASAAGWTLVGASPASTGLPGSFEHFETPLGVFEHSLANPDFRAEGTRNANGIRGYGVAGMRVYDFGWIAAPRTWGKRGPGIMRLQLHATDPDRLEPMLGVRRSKGCIRIPAALNAYIDRYGLLDFDYERALAEGRPQWVLRADRRPTPWSGRYLVVVDSQRTQRPAWSPLPGRRRSTVAQAGSATC